MMAAEEAEPASPPFCFVREKGARTSRNNETDLSNTK